MIGKRYISISKDAIVKPIKKMVKNHQIMMMVIF